MKTLQAHYLKMKQNRKKRRIIFCSIVVFLSAIVLLGYLFLFSPIFKVKNIEINQTHILDSTVIQQGVQKILSQGLALGPLVINNNILFVPTAQINDYLRSFFAIESFSQNKSFFSKSLKISIQEREIAGVLSQALGKNYYFDKNGVIFADALDSEGKIILIMENNSERQFDLGNCILEAIPFQGLMSIIQLLNTNFSSSRVKLQKDKLEIIATHDSGKETSFYLNTDNLSQTYSVLTYFIQNSFDFNLEYLDLRYLPNVYYK